MWEMISTVGSHNARAIRTSFTSKLHTAGISPIPTQGPPIYTLSSFVRAPSFVRHSFANALVCDGGSTRSAPRLQDATKDWTGNAKLLA